MRIGLQHEHAVEFLVLLDPFAVDGEALALWVLEESAVALVADEALVAFLQLPLQGGDDGRAIGGVLVHLVEAAAHDVAPPGERDGLRLVVDLAPRLHQDEGNERRGVAEHEVAHQPVGPLAHAQDIEKLARLKLGDRLGADHAAVGDDTDAVDAEAALQAVDRRDQAFHVGGVSRPHLGAHGAAVAVEQHGENHLVEIGPMVLREAAPSERLAAGALEIEAGRVHEHDVERAQKVPPAAEQLFLQDVLHAARRKRRRGVLLVLGQFLAQPRHRAIEMMQLDPVDAVDAVVLAPAVGGAIRAAADEAVKHGQERRALQREIMVASPRQAFDHAPAAGLFPHPLEGERRTDAPRRDRRRLAAVERVEYDRLVGEARARAQQALQLPALPQLVDPPERGDHLLADRAALAPALDDLQIGATVRGLFAEIHGGEPGADSILVRTLSACSPNKSTTIKAKRGTTISRSLPIAPNHINGLRRTPMRQLSKISQEAPLVMPASKNLHSSVRAL